MKTDIEEIVNGIGSPFGEGATYNGKRKEKTSHLDDEDYTKLVADITTLTDKYEKKIKQKNKEIARWKKSNRTMQKTISKLTDKVREEAHQAGIDEAVEVIKENKGRKCSLECGDYEAVCPDILLEALQDNK